MYCRRSGSKGFHVITNLGAMGEYSNVAMKWVARTFSDKCDPSMYKIRSMFRLPNSMNSKTGLYKIQVDEGLTVEQIVEMARSPKPYDKIGIDYDNTKFLEEHDESVDNYLDAVYNREDVIEIKNTDWSRQLPPCIKYMLEHGVPVGYRWHMCFYLVRLWRLCGMDVDDAIFTADGMDIFSYAGYTGSMIRHYYHRDPMSVGCKTGVMSDVMQAHCVVGCEYREDYVDELARNFIQSF